MHTLIASIALKDGRPWQVFGCMGADGQPQIHLQSYVRLIDFGFDIQQALELPRWLSDASTSATRATCSTSKGVFRRRP